MMGHVLKNAVFCLNVLSIVNELEVTLCSSRKPSCMKNISQLYFLRWHKDI